MKLIVEKKLHTVFVVSLILKGLFALFEIIAGIIAFFLNWDFILDYANSISEDILIENSNDLVANYLRQWAQTFSVSAQHFTEFYLLSHGIIKLWLIVGLLKNKLGYYPISIAVFSMFILYQLYRYSFTHSLTLIIITVIDVLIIVLIWHEYRLLKKLKW